MEFDKLYVSGKILIIIIIIIAKPYGASFICAKES